jgi:hypothetical protein
VRVVFIAVVLVAMERLRGLLVASPRCGASVHMKLQTVVGERMELYRLTFLIGIRVPQAIMDTATYAAEAAIETDFAQECPCC